MLMIIMKMNIETNEPKSCGWTRRQTEKDTIRHTVALVPLFHRLVLHTSPRCCSLQFRKHLYRLTTETHYKANIK